MTFSRILWTKHNMKTHLLQDFHHKNQIPFEKNLLVVYFDVIKSSG